MTVQDVFVKARKGMPMVPPPDGRIRLVAGLGVEGDANACAVSPRQVLLAFESFVAALGLRPGDLKENVLLAGATEKDLPSGTLVRLGSAELRITFPCEPCGYLRTVGIERPASARGMRGLLAVVVEGGEIAVGDGGSVAEAPYPPVPSDFVDRLPWVVSRIPAGSVATYSMLANLAGVSSAYLRALPGMLRSGRFKSLPYQRVVDSRGGLIPGLSDQQERLALEGVSVSGGRVEAARHWSGAGLYSSKDS